MAAQSGGAAGAMLAGAPGGQRVCGALLLGLAAMLALASRISPLPAQVSPCLERQASSGNCGLAGTLPHLRLELGNLIILNEPLGSGLPGLLSADRTGRVLVLGAGQAEPLQLGLDVEALIRASPPDPLDLGASIEESLAGVEALPEPTGATRGQAHFILTAAEAARASQRVTGVPASVTIAQAILESAWGGSKLASDGNNYFGIKARDRGGTAGVIWFDTWEVIGGRNVIQHEPFRAYSSAADSFIDHGRFFLENARYAAALAARDDPRQFAREINRAGYATDPNYAPKLIALMDRFDLYSYDP